MSAPVRTCPQMSTTGQDRTGHHRTTPSSPASTRFQGCRPRWFHEALDSERAADLQRELGPDWMTPLPPNPTPHQECLAWIADAEKTWRAGQVVDFRRRLEEAA